MKFVLDSSYLLVRSLLEDGRFKEALEWVSTSVRESDADPALLREAGLVMCLTGEFSRAEAFWRTALAAQPAEEALRYGLADLLCSMGRSVEALALVQEAGHLSECARFSGVLNRIQLSPGTAGESPLAQTMGVVSVGSEGEQERKGWDLEGLREKVGKEPGSYEAWWRLGIRAFELGLLEEATRAFLKGYALRPGSDAVLVQLGVVFWERSKRAEAASCFVAATRLHSAGAEAFCRLGWAMLEFGQHEEALRALNRAVELKPGWALPQRYSAGALLQIGRHEAALDKLRSLLGMNPHDASLHSQLLAALHYVPNRDRAARFAEFGEFARKFETPRLSRGGGATPWRAGPGRRIRVGYVSGDFRRHSVAFFVEPLLLNHDREAFEVFCYMTRSDSDEVTRRLQFEADHWRSVERLSVEDFAARIRADGIDILVDLSNHSSDNRLLVFPLHPAPVQVTMIGLHHTTGLRSIGYRITDAVLDPPGEEVFNSEALVRLESGPMVFLPPCDGPDVNELPAGAGHPFTLGCTNHLEKVNAGVLAVWAKILKALPEARLLFFGRSGNRFVKELGKLGIPPRRLLEEPQQGLGGFLEAHHRIDLALDPFPYNGLTATLLSAWMGVPCVTLEGDFPPARASACVMKRLEMEWFIAKSERDYLQKTIAIASDIAGLARVRAGLRSRVVRNWCDAPAHVRELEEAYRRMLFALPEGFSSSGP